MTHSNCFFALVYLALRGKLSSIAVLSPDPSVFFPTWHFVGVNKRGHVLHFQRSLPDAENYWAPWWFKGTIHGVSRDRQFLVLEQSHRRLLWWTERVGPALVLFLTQYVVMSPVWILIWLLFRLRNAVRPR